MYGKRRIEELGDNPQIIARGRSNPQSVEAVLKTSIKYLRYDISDSLCLKEFPTPKSVHQVRQFLRCSARDHSVKEDFALAKPLANPLKKDPT